MTLKFQDEMEQNTKYNIRVHIFLRHIATSGLAEAKCEEKHTKC